MFSNIQQTMYWSENEFTVDSTKAWMTYIVNQLGFYDAYEQSKVIGSTFAWVVRAGVQ